jgi:hypothetical protein
LGFRAELRRELKWGNWVLLFFWVLLEVPRSGTEEGGQFVCTLCYLGDLIGLLGYLPVVCMGPVSLGQG